MACNCEGKNYNISMGCCEPVLAPIENYYTKYQVDKLIESATTSGCCITPEEVDEKIASAKTEIENEIPSLSGYATEQWVLDKHYISGVDLSDYALKSEIPTVPTSNTAFTNDAGYLTEHQHLKTINGESLIGDGNIVISGDTDLSNYYTKTETNNQISSATADMATKTWVGQQGYLTEHQSLSGYVTDAEMSAFTYDKATIDEKVAQGGTFDPTQYYNTAQTINLVESAVTRVEGEIPSLSGYATEQWVLDKHYISGVDLSDYALKSEIPTVPTSNTAFTNDAGYLTEHQSLSGYATEQWVEDQHYITGVDLSNYATKAEIPVVPTSNTAFTNDAGYLTEHQQLKTINNQSITGTGNITIECECSGVTSGEVQTMIDQSVSGKVDTTTYNTYTAATQTTISNKADSSTLNNYLLKNKIWCGTQSQYNSIGTKDPETLYLIHS